MLVHVTVQNYLGLNMHFLRRPYFTHRYTYTYTYKMLRNLDANEMLENPLKKLLLILLYKENNEDVCFGKQLMIPVWFGLYVTLSQALKFNLIPLLKSTFGPFLLWSQMMLLLVTPCLTLLSCVRRWGSSFLCKCNANKVNNKCMLGQIPQWQHEHWRWLVTVECMHLLKSTLWSV